MTALLLALPKHLIIQTIAVILNSQLHVIVDRDSDDLIALWLVVWIVELCHVWVTQGLFCRDTFLRVEHEAALNEVQSCLVSSWEDLSQWTCPACRE